jgi:hypothetical protein
VVMRKAMNKVMHVRRFLSFTTSSPSPLPLHVCSTKTLQSHNMFSKYPPSMAHVVCR